MIIYCGFHRERSANTLFLPPGVVLDMHPSGAGPEPSAGEREGEPLARKRPKPKAAAVGHFRDAQNTSPNHLTP